MNYCVGFIFNRHLDKILLVKKNPRDLPDRALANFMMGKLNAIGGKLEGNESAKDGMIRECKEETGLDIIDWNHFCTLNTRGGNIFFFYSVTDDISNYKQLEHEELRIYSLYFDAEDRLNLFYQDHNRMPNLDWLIPMALNHMNKLDGVEQFEIKEVY